MEELKEIATIIESLGANGTRAFIWWLIVSKGLAFVESLAWIGATVFIIGRVARGVVGAIKAGNE